MILTRKATIYNSGFDPSQLMARRRSIACLGLVVWFACGSLFANALRTERDYLEIKQGEARELDEDYVETFSRREGRRFQRVVENRTATPLKQRTGNVFDVEKIKNYKVLRDDQVVELRNPRSGKVEITILKAAALPEDELYRHDLEYHIVELDQLAIEVEKHDEKPRTVKVDWDGNFRYPLIGEVKARGSTLAEIELQMEKMFLEYIKEPEVSVSIAEKSPLASIRVIGKAQPEIYTGAQRALDVVGERFKELTEENVYDKICVIRKKDDGTLLCIVIDVAHMFESYDFRQNIPLKAGDIVFVKTMPRIFGNRFHFWWEQLMDWFKEVDFLLGDIKTVHEWRLED